MSDETVTETNDVAPEEVALPPEEEASQAADAESLDTEDTEPEVFPRSYVEDLRRENGKYRQRAQRADELAHRLHTELVRATGKLADPTDLPFDESHLDDNETLTAAIDELLARKPHLAARRPIGEIGQGAKPSSGSVDLAAILRQKAG
jgi:hypothetical protein